MNKTIGFFYIAIIVCSTTISLYGADKYLDIDANEFEANESKNIIYFKGSVKMKKNKDLLLCQNLTIKTKNTKEKKQLPVSYKAIGNVSFTIHTADNLLMGKGDTVFYYPKDQKYIIIGHGYLKDTKEAKEITAHKIYIDEKTGYTKIDGNSNKPIKFRLKLEDTK
jgi:lipopolysaccharide transport protein LptA